MDSQAKEKEIFPRLIKELRTQRGLTQVEFGQVFEPPVSQQTVAGWERGENVPARKYWPKIAALADMEIGQFYEYVGTGLNSTASLLEEIVLKIKSLAPKELEVVTRVTDEQWAEFAEVRPKANKQHIALFKKGTAGWNRWREKNPAVRPELYGLDLSNLAIELDGVDLSGADLREAQLQHAGLLKANLSGANLSGANLSSANLNGADLEYANLSHANLDSSYLSSANLRWANLSYANLRDANLNEANLRGTNLSDADLTFADLRWAILVETNLERAALVNCSVYGASVWRPKLDEAKQSELNTCVDGNEVISKDSIFTVDNLELAPVLYTIRNNPQLYKTLRQRFQEEEKVIRYAQELVDNYGKDLPNGSRIYFDLNNRWCEVYQEKDLLEVRAFDARERNLLLWVFEGKIKSNLRPGDLDNLKALVDSEAGKKAASQSQQKNQDQTQQKS